MNRDGRRGATGCVCLGLRRGFAGRRPDHRSYSFGWMFAENPYDAYRLECYLWHAQGGAWARIEGDAQPVPDERIPFLGCPDCEE